MFETFECLVQNLSNFSCQFRNEKLIPFQILHHYSMLRHATPLQTLSSYIFFFELKHTIKLSIYRLSSALVKFCQITHGILQTTSQFFFKYCIILQCHEKKLFCTFLVQTLNTLCKRSPLKFKFLRFLSALVAIRQITHVILKWQVNSSSIREHSDTGRSFKVLRKLFQWAIPIIMVGRLRSICVKEMSIKQFFGCRSCLEVMVITRKKLSKLFILFKLTDE